MSRGITRSPDAALRGGKFPTCRCATSASWNLAATWYTELTPADATRGTAPMLSIDTRPGRLCASPSRRELLTVGSVALAGLSLPQLLQASATRPTAPPRQGFGRATSLIFLYLQGAPSHIDLW